MTSLTSKLLGEAPVKAAPAPAPEYYTVLSKTGRPVSTRLMGRAEAEGVATRRGGSLVKIQFVPEEVAPDPNGIAYRSLRTALKAFKPKGIDYLWSGSGPGGGRTATSIDATEASLAAFGFDPAQATAAWKQLDQARRDEAKASLANWQNSGNQHMIRAVQNWIDEPAAMRLHIVFSPTEGTYEAELHRDTEGSMMGVPDMETQGRIEDALAAL